MGALPLPAFGCAPTAVPGPGPGTCRVCRAPARHGYSICTSCRRTGLALGSPLVPIHPLALVTPASPLYRALRQYKSGEPDVARRQQDRLAALLAHFVDRHFASLAPGGADLVVVVPSGDRRRPPPHPLIPVVIAAGIPAPVDALRPGVHSVDHGRPSPQGYRAGSEVSGCSVVLLDDVYTTGAHLQSAAVALRSAGARSVHSLVLGRYLTG